MAKYTIFERPQLYVVGITCRTSNAPDAGPRDIPKLWEKFAKENYLSKIPNRVSSEVVCLYCDYESDHTGEYTVVIGCPVSSLTDIPQGMVAKTVPAGSYAVFQAVGDDPTALIETWIKIWNTKLKRTYTGDYELYGEKFYLGTPKTVEIFIAIKS